MFATEFGLTSTILKCKVEFLANVVNWSICIIVTKSVLETVII